MAAAVGYALIAFAAQAGATDYSAGAGAGTATGSVATAGDYGCSFMASARFTSACQATASPRAFGVYNTAVGDHAYASLGSTVMGDHAFGNSYLATAFGSYSEATQYFSTAVGAGASASAMDAVALGHSASASGFNASALGESARATASAATAIGRGALASAAGATALGAGSVANQANTVSVGTAAAGGQRRIVNLADGTAGTDAVNLKQLNAAVANKADTLLFKADGSTAAVASGTHSVAVGHVASASQAGSIAVGSQARSSGVSALAMGNLATASGDRSVAAGTTALSSGAEAVALGDHASATATNAVAMGWNAKASHANALALGAMSATDRANSVSVGSALLQRQITQLAAGTQDTDAINLGQLKHTAASVSAVLGRNVPLDAAGTGFGEATFWVGDIDTHSVTEAFEALNAWQTRVKHNLRALDEQTDALTHGLAGMVLQDPATAEISVAPHTAGDTIAIDGTNGRRRLTGLANGLNDDEAVTIAQLKAAGVLDPTSGTILSAVTYDDTSLATARLGGTRGTTISNLADGQIASGSMQAINGGQLFQQLTDVASLLGGGASVGLQGTFVSPTYAIQNGTYHNVGDALAVLDDKVSELDQRIGSGTSRMGRMAAPSQAMIEDVGAVAAAPAATPTALNAVAADPSTALDASTRTTDSALGTGAVASGIGSVAVGDHAIATADGSVALGSGSIADRANAVSVGSTGNERQIAHVADATEATDAVNKGQLDRGVASANRYTDAKMEALNDSFQGLRGEVDGRLRNMDRRIDRQGAMSAAMLNMATSAAGIRTDNRVGVGVGFQGSESALSVGYQRALSDRATVTFGGAFSGDDASVGFGAGFGW